MYLRAAAGMGTVEARSRRGRGAVGSRRTDVLELLCEGLLLREDLLLLGPCERVHRVVLELDVLLPDRPIVLDLLERRHRVVDKIDPRVLLERVQVHRGAWRRCGDGVG